MFVGFVTKRITNQKYLPENIYEVSESESSFLAVPKQVQTRQTITSWTKTTTRKSSSPVWEITKAVPAPDRTVHCD